MANAPEIAVAYVSIVPEIQGFARTLRDQVVGPAEAAGEEAGTAAGSGLADKLKAGAALAGVAAGAVMGKALADAFEQASVTKKMQAQLGATSQDAKKYGDVAGKLFTSGVVDNFQEGADAIKAVMTSGIAPPKATQAQLQAVATKAADVAKVFDQDLGGVTNAVSQLMRTGLAKNSTEAFDLITKGFQSSANKADDLLDTVNEYSVQFQRFGLDGATAMGLINQAVKAGARDSDQVADALGQFGERALAGGTAVEDAYKSIGLNAGDMAKKIGAGGDTAKSALTDTLNALRGTKDEQVKLNAAAALFGDPANVMGNALYAMDTATAAASGGFDKLGGATGKLGDTMRSGPLYELQTFTRELQQGLVVVMGEYVIPAIKGAADIFLNDLVPAFKSAYQWALDWSPVLTGLTVFIGGLALAVKAAAIQTAIFGGVAKVTAFFTNAWAVAQGILNAVMALNPITLIVIALVALAAAVYVAWQRSETFRKVVTGAWDAIKAAAMTAWNDYLQPALAAMVDGFKWVGDKAVWLWENGIKPAFDGIMSAIKWVGDTAMWLWNSAIKPAFDGIVMAGRILATAIAFVVIAPIVLAVKGLGLLFGWLWTDAIKPAIDAIVAGALWLWDSGIKPVFDLIAGLTKWLWENGIKPWFGFLIEGLKTIGGWFSWLWTNAVQPVLGWIADKAMWLWNKGIKPAFGYLTEGLKTLAGWLKWLWTEGVRAVFNWIADKAKWLWNNGVKPAFDNFKAGIRVLKDAVKWLWDNGIKPVFGWIADKASWLWNKGVKPAFDALKKGVDAVGDSFKKGKDFIGEQWGKLQDIAKKPVRFIIDTVYNGGIVPLWNKIASAFGAPKLDKLSLKGFARGGILPGMSSWRNGDDQLVPMRRGEGVYVSEAMRDPYERARLHAVNRAAMSGQSLSKFRDSGFAKGGVVGEGFAKGGIFGWIGNKLQGAGSAAWEGIKKGANWLGDTLESSARAGVKEIVNPLIDRIPGSSTLFGQAVRGIPDKIIDSIFGYSKKADQKIVDTGVGGAGTRSALAWARTQAGKPYQWAGAGNPSWDCSGFMAGIQKKIMGQNPNGRLWSTFAFNGAQAPAGWVRGMKAPYMIGITNAGVGHTAGTLNGVNVESRGGAGVVVGSRARGYRDALFTDWYGFEPSKKYDNGGWLMPGARMTANETGKPEPVFTASQWSVLSTLAARGADSAGGVADGTRLVLVTDGGSFEAYVDRRADDRIKSGLTGPAGLGRNL